VKVIVVRLGWALGEGTGVGDDAGTDAIAEGGVEGKPLLDALADGWAELPAAVVGLGRTTGSGPPVITTAAVIPPRRARTTARMIAMVRQRSITACVS
jgi:hypothetical protein